MNSAELADDDLYLAFFLDARGLVTLRRKHEVHALMRLSLPNRRDHRRRGSVTGRFFNIEHEINVQTGAKWITRDYFAWRGRPPLHGEEVRSLFILSPVMPS